MSVNFEQFSFLVIDCIKESTGQESGVTEGCLIHGSGLDSVASLTLMVRAEDELELKIPPSAFVNSKTFGELFSAAKQ